MFGKLTDIEYEPTENVESGYISSDESYDERTNIGLYMSEEILKTLVSVPEPQYTVPFIFFDNTLKRINSMFPLENVEFGYK